MKILWLGNVILPEASEYLKIKKTVVGGWIEGQSEGLKQLNEDNTVDGILVQLPLPKHINEDIVFYMIILVKIIKLSMDVKTYIML